MGTRHYAHLRRVIVILIPALLVCASTARAAMEVITLAEAPAVLNFSGREIQLPRFDPSLGVLQSVIIDVKSTGSFVQGFDHLSGSHRDLSGQSNLRLTLQTEDGETLVALSQFSDRYQSSPGHHDGTDSSGLRLEPIKAAGQATLTSNQELMEFTGCGFVDLFLSGRSGLGHSSSLGNSLLSGLLVAGADIKLTYTYAAVPENSTWIAAAFAIILLVLIKRCNTREVSSVD